MVERVTGCPRDTFLKVARTLLANSGPDRTCSFAYAVAWTQPHQWSPDHRLRRAAPAPARQLRPAGAGIMALRGHASIQGSTDVPTLYHSIHGYMPAPTALKPHDTLDDYLREETVATGYWAHTPKFMVSYLKSMWGDAATRENQFGYDWHPKILGDHSHLPMFVRWPTAGQGHALRRSEPGHVAQRPPRAGAMRKLEWLVVKDNWLHESATFWKKRARGPERRGQARGHQDRDLLLPVGAGGETEGTFTNTQRMLQWHYKAAEAPGACRTDVWFTYQLGKRLQEALRPEQAPRDAGFKNLVFDYEHEDDYERSAGSRARQAPQEVNG